ncbi:MAG TPA: hypothetical protein VMW38_02930 [Terriglobia bacterium]|nr:hypothetical protein [Terriglobia bacterium]
MWETFLSLFLCHGNHRCIMHFLGNEKVWECTRCGRVFPIPESLTRVSGSFSLEAQERARLDRADEHGKPPTHGEAPGKIQGAQKTHKKGA